ncbi:MAG: rod shape-determining protein MreC [Nitrospira sp.]|jgi:rod shape-determining protein MreC|nr:rod shape-determining protein MreC [Nitrospira sp.]MDH5625883.1 rod shape-determining protein MreC [Nitrospira sp.]
MRMVNFRLPYNTGRIALVLAAVLLVGFLLLPSQLQGVFQEVGSPIGWVLSWPLRAAASVQEGIADFWGGFVALRGVAEENKELRKELEHLKGQNSQLREAAVATERLTALLEFKTRAELSMVAAQVIGRDTGNWYRTIILNKGESDGFKSDMGVITSAGVVGRIVKTTAATSVVLLVTDPNNAIAGLVQRTRDEGIVEGTTQGMARLKYIPLLSNARPGDRVVTSGLVGGFPRGLAIGTITRINKDEEALFQFAELTPDVDVGRVEEVLVIQSPNVQAEGEQLGVPAVRPKS